MRCILIVNGLDHAFLREFGCDCKRCSKSRKAANTSISLVVLDDNYPILHILFDVGMHVVDSLCDIPYFKDPKHARLDWLVFTHWHPDHVLDINRLCETWKRNLNRSNKPWEPIKTWCRSGTAKWIEINHSYEWNEFLRPYFSNEFKPLGTLLDPIPIEFSDLEVIPVTVSHYSADIKPRNPKEYLPCSASFIIKHKNKKAVLLWDIDNRNDWIANPLTNEQTKAVNLLSKADYLFIECNTWKVEGTGHATFLTAKEYIKALRPKQTFLVHLSGHEDRSGPGYGWDDKTWEEEAKKVLKAEKTNIAIQVPKIGEEYEI